MLDHLLRRATAETFRAHARHRRPDRPARPVRRRRHRRGRRPAARRGAAAPHRRGPRPGQDHGAARHGGRVARPRRRGPGVRARRPVPDAPPVQGRRDGTPSTAPEQSAESAEGAVRERLPVRPVPRRARSAGAAVRRPRRPRRPGRLHAGRHRPRRARCATCCAGACPGHRGLDDLLRQVRERQRELRDRGRLDGTLEQARALLDTAIGQERAELFPDPTTTARLREAELDTLPADTAQAIRQLADYEWQSPAAGRPSRS